MAMALSELAVVPVASCAVAESPQKERHPHRKNISEAHTRFMLPKPGHGMYRFCRICWERKSPPDERKSPPVKRRPQKDTPASGVPSRGAATVSQGVPSQGAAAPADSSDSSSDASSTSSDPSAEDVAEPEPAAHSHKRRRVYKAEDAAATDPH